MKFARVPDSITDLVSYLEKDKIYEVVDTQEKSGNIDFIINSDQLKDVTINADCLLKGCAHLDGGDWEVFDEMPKVS